MLHLPGRVSISLDLNGRLSDGHSSCLVSGFGTYFACPKVCVLATVALWPIRSVYESVFA